MGRRQQDQSKEKANQEADASSSDAEEDHLAVLEDFWQGEHFVIACPKGPMRT